jgi:hypothetical protein
MDKLNLTDDLTDAQKIMVRIAFEDGQKIGKKIASAIQSGELQVPDNQTMAILIDQFIQHDFVKYQKILAKFGSPQFAIGGNLGCAGGGLAICGVSAIKFLKTKNTMARIFYGTGSVCGSTAAIAGTLKAFSGTCGLSFLAVGGDMFGGACLYVGNKAQKMGDMVNDKHRLSWRPRSFARRPNYKSGMGYRGLSFITAPGSGDFSFAGVPQVIPHISYETILIIAGTVFTIYSYIKVTKVVYRYSKSKIFPKIDRSKVIHKSAVFLIDSINNTPYMKKVNRVYSAALKLEYSSF